MTRVLGFASPKVVLPQCEAVARPRQAVSGTPARRAPAERRRPGASVLAADKATRSEPCIVRILPPPATTAPRHGAPWIHGRPRAASAVARVVYQLFGHPKTRSESRVCLDRRGLFCC